MEDLRAEYKKKFEAAEDREKQFRQIECNECGIWSLYGHKAKSGNCKYLAPARVEVDYNYDSYGAKTISLPLSITVKNVGCELVAEQVEEDFSHILDKGIVRFENMQEVAKYYEQDIIDSHDDINHVSLSMFVQGGDGPLCFVVAAQVFQWFTNRAVFTIADSPDGGIYVTKWRDD